MEEGGGNASQAMRNFLKGAVSIILSQIKSNQILFIYAETLIKSLLQVVD